MITGQIKNQIDQIWDTFWTGGITNSITILEQMTYLFFMKMLDDQQLQQEQVSQALGIDMVQDAAFSYGTWHNPDTGEDVPLDSLRWHVFKHYDPEKMFRTISRDAFAYIKHLNSGSDSAYSRFMGSAIFLIQNPRTLVKIVDGIDSLDMNNRDTMGDTYEYILGKMAASGNNGQFRTPRHIIRMMVELMQPTLADTVCDPAMGSAGFIVETAKYIKEHYANELMNPANDRHFRSTMLHGFDTDQTMLRSLEVGGRCASIVPDGVLTGSSNAHKAIRKAIVDGNRLEAVISMPSGVFQPYSGVSTAILIFTKTKAGGTDKVWFYDIKADGFSLDQKRTEVAENDIPDVISRFHNPEGETERTRTDQSFLVPVDEIREHQYDLAFNTYKETVREVVEYEAPEIILGRAQALTEQIIAGMKELETLIAKKHEA